MSGPAVEGCPARVGPPLHPELPGLALATHHPELESTILLVFGNLSQVYAQLTFVSVTLR